MKRYAVHLADHRSVPTVGAECYHVIWSQGRACLKCGATCYRAGWNKESVDIDNAELVKRRIEKGESESEVRDG